MNKDERVFEIDKRIKELEYDPNIWHAKGEKGKILSVMAGSEIFTLSLERDDLVNGTHHLEIMFLTNYLRELMSQDFKDPVRIKETEEQIQELLFQDYINTEGFSKTLSS